MSAPPAGYNAAAAWYDRLAAPLWEHTAGRTALKRVRREVRQHLPRGAHVLDVGAGTGRYVTITTFGKRCQLSAVPAPRQSSGPA